RLRSHPSTEGIPIVMLTARNDETDRVVGFEVGADDYVGKPFSIRELVLRCKAILRRSRRVAGLDAATPGELRFGALRIDTAGHRVWLDGEELRLTAIEFRLLSTL